MYTRYFQSRFFVRADVKRQIDWMPSEVSKSNLEPKKVHGGFLEAFKELEFDQ